MSLAATFTAGNAALAGQPVAASSAGAASIIAA
jgi:hypothetical protein